MLYDPLVSLRPGGTALVRTLKAQVSTFMLAGFRPETGTSLCGDEQAGNAVTGRSAQRSARRVALTAWGRSHPTGERLFAEDPDRQVRTCGPPSATDQVSQLPIHARRDRHPHGPGRAAVQRRGRGPGRLAPRARCREAGRAKFRRRQSDSGAEPSSHVDVCQRPSVDAL